MRIRLPLHNSRLNEMVGILTLLLSIGVLFCLLTYSPLDPSANVATDVPRATNWMGLPGAFVADLVLQALGIVGFLIPVWLGLVGLGRVRSVTRDHLGRRMAGGMLLTMVLCCALQLGGRPVEALMPEKWDGTVRAGGVVGVVAVEASTSLLNVGGTLLLMLAFTAGGLYLMTSLRVADIFGRREKAGTAEEPPDDVPEEEEEGETTVIPVAHRIDSTQSLPEPPPLPGPGGPTWESATTMESAEGVPFGETLPGSPIGRSLGSAVNRPEPNASGVLSMGRSTVPEYVLPNSDLLNRPQGREPYDEAQLQARARLIVEKFAEFGAMGSVAQINPGPVVTTFEFKPDRGIKYSKVVNLSEDLCLALECESVLVERIPGKSTVGVEVPNTKREIISFREVVDSGAFRQSKSMLTFALGKDINGKIHCTDLASMPHLLVAGQTGSGKSVMVNCVIMSILLRATPDDVRLILVDPKTVELGLYRDVPHLLTPVITDVKVATNALKNATREMERRLQLLAQHGVRNISQFNEKVAGTTNDQEEPVPRLPFIVVIVDELADLMMLAGRQVEESIQRLAQMARAVGIHLLLATQRPSVDVITGLIKANIPARLSFLLATRVDSRTILDSMGAESLLGKGDMLFLPPGVARRTRLHGPLVLEDEIERVVSYWKDQADPRYENDYLEAPEGEGKTDLKGEAGLEDPMYRTAVQLVLEMGKASTSTLQRRLRLGYGRAARILDAMEREGIIGPPDGSRPREVLKRPG